MTLNRDLAEYCKLVSKMFKWPETKSDWAKHRLSEELLAIMDPKNETIDKTEKPKAGNLE